MPAEWERNPDTIAERFKKDEIPGFLRKEFFAKENEWVVVEKNGEIYRERGPGKFSITGFSGGVTSILLLDKGEKTIEREVKNVWLSDGKKIDITFTLRFRVFHSDHFSKRLMGERKKFTTTDVWDETLSKVLCKKILPDIEKKRAGDFLRDDFREDLKKSVEGYIKKSFRDWGILLLSISVDFRIPEDAKETEGMGEERKTGEEKTEEVKEEKASSETEEEKKLREELEELGKAKEIAEKKFYKKELSEEAFQRMMEDFEKRIIEIETKLKEKKGD